MERLLLLWDELDELMGYGRHLAVGFSQAMAASSLAGVVRNRLQRR